MSILVHPKQHSRKYSDERSKEVMLKTIDFFETRGKQKLKEDDRNRVWYSDFLDFVKKERIFATLMTPDQYGADDCRWDTWRNCEFAEILGFYGLHFWYAWQVSVLGLGPIWMSDNEELKERAAQQLEDGEIFAFGLSEKEHGADLYSTDMILSKNGDGSYSATGDKYYIGNSNEARMVSTFAKTKDTDEFVFFSVDSQHEKYEAVKNITNTQSWVGEYRLNDYPVAEGDILSVGDEAWSTALNTINVGKYNLGWASIGICTHALYEAINHAANRSLYGQYVTDFSHVKQLFVDGYARLVAMKLVALRAADYLRSASPDDRRYLLYNPIVKMKVTTQGEDVINHLWDVIAAKGFEKDMYFEMAGRDIRSLPKLEGTVHVNIALIMKFLPNYLFNPADYEEVPTRDDAINDDFLFNQGPTKGLSKVQFHNYEIAYSNWDLPNVNIFKEQIGVFKKCMAEATPNQEQQTDVDFLLAVGELFTLVAYGQLILENAKIYELEDDLVDQIFDVLVRDFSRYAVDLHNKPTSTDEQQQFCQQMICKPAVDAERFDRIWQTHVHALNGAYEMND